MIEWFKGLSLSFKIFVILVIAVVLGGIIALIIIFVPRYTGPEENCVFIGEETNLHSEYVISVISVAEYDNINIIKNENDTETSTIIGTDKHYLQVTLKIKHENVADPKENHEFDKNDFKLKDHTGIKLGNIYFGSVENGSVLSQTNFSTRNAIEDFAWCNTEIACGEEKSIVVYFELSKDQSVKNIVMVIEADFFWGGGNNTATDIVLAQRTN